MKKIIKPLLKPLLLAGLCSAGGCNTPISLTGDYATPRQTIAGAINAATNGVTVSGAYGTTNQTIGGSVTVGK